MCLVHVNSQRKVTDEIMRAWLKNVCKFQWLHEVNGVT